MRINEIYEGDCLEVMRQFPDNCIDSIVTDPPYELTGKSGNGGFMGKQWDASGIAFNPEVWREALRVAKPSATLMAFGGTRTYHRLACAIEDAGWEIRDCINYLHDGNGPEAAFMASLNEEQLAAYLELHYPNNQMAWVYGSGIGLGHAIGKAIDKASIVNCPDCKGGWILPVDEDYVRQFAIEESIPVLEAIAGFQVKCETCGGSGKVKGAEREVIGKKIDISSGKPMSVKQAKAGTDHNLNEGYDRPWRKDNEHAERMTLITAPATPLAAKFEGYNSRLKPAYEIIVVAQAPLDGTYADNAEKWGVAGLNIDGCRIGTEKRLSQAVQLGSNGIYGKLERNDSFTEANGRYPANIIHSGEPGVMAEFAKAGVSVSNVRQPTGKYKMTGSLNDSNAMRGSSTLDTTIRGHFDTGTPARYFATCPPDEAARFIYCPKAPQSERSTPGNTHPTQKPLSLVRYLVRLTRPPDGGVVLDPFAGSGTTALACIAENRDYILIEKEPEYAELCRRRIAEYTGAEVAPVEIKVKSDVVKQMSLW